MAQMPIQQVAGRAQYFPPPPTTDAMTHAAAPQARAAAPAKVVPQSTQAPDPAAIPGGKLRPGSIDQMTFRQRMMALNRADPPTALTAARNAAPTPRPAPLQTGGPLIDTAPRAPLLGPAPSQKMPSIPTLTPAQLAALGVDVSALPEMQGSEAPQDPAAQAVPQDAPFFDAATEPASPELAAPEIAAPSEQPQTAALQVPDESAVEDPETDTGPQGPMPGSRLGQDGVWELPRNPDRDERDWLRGMNAKWRIVENPDSVKLFLGADGKFGFDDFLDVINPLQHIPLVNIAYRKLTGDTVDGAAQLLGAIPFGPMSVASNLADIALRSETGEGLAENAIAMVFGDGGSSGADSTDAIATASGRTTQVAEIRRGSNK